MSMISRVYAMGPAPVPTGQVAADRDRAARAALWHKKGIVVLDPEDITDDWLRQAILNEAEAAFGRRRGRKGA